MRSDARKRLEHTTENDAPAWYVEHFLPFGYTADRLRQAWAGLSDSARADYRARLAPTRVTPPGLEATS